ncbi:hypothetical protein MMSP_5367 [Mycobacterium sp. 012931]|nr:hypothetical protein MMSP_5367 [Mycobacterium sp. 012931]MBC9863366.1 hypothetical protein [Mycobacterium pseudoshottsii]
MSVPEQDLDYAASTTPQLGQPGVLRRRCCGALSAFGSAIPAGALASQPPRAQFG